VPDVREKAVKIVTAGGKDSRYYHYREKLNEVMKGWGGGIVFPRYQSGGRHRAEKNPEEPIVTN
jgi:hypothetical protein